MSSLNQLISEIANSIQQADSISARRAIRQAIIHSRNELIRQSFANHNYTDKVLKQRYRVSLQNVADGDIKDTEGLGLKNIKRSVNKVPRPVRLNNALPFHSVRTTGVTAPIVIAYVGETLSRYYDNLPGMQNVPTYDYINDYIYINKINDSVDYVIVEAVFEYPHEIMLENSETGEYKANIDDNDEFFLPEDLVNSVKKLTLETFNAQLRRETNEVPVQNLVK